MTKPQTAKQKSVSIPVVMDLAAKLGCESLAHFPPEGAGRHFVRVFTKENATIAAASGRSRASALRAVHAALTVLAEEA